MESSVLNNREQAIKIIKRLVSELLPGSQILLFGSRASGNDARDSDYDLLIITEEAMPEKTRRHFQSVLRKQLAEYKIPSDILIYSHVEVQSKKELFGHIVRDIINEGITL
jgi:predicted nucleotidyltransferase